MICVCIFSTVNVFCSPPALELRRVDSKSRCTSAHGQLEVRLRRRESREQGHRQNEERPLTSEVRKKRLQMHKMRKVLSRIKLRSCVQRPLHCTNEDRTLLPGNANGASWELEEQCKGWNK